MFDIYPTTRVAFLADVHHNTMWWDCPLELASQLSIQPTACFHGHFCSNVSRWRLAPCWTKLSTKLSSLYSSGNGLLCGCWRKHFSNYLVKQYYLCHIWGPACIGVTVIIIRSNKFQSYSRMIHPAAPFVIKCRLLSTYCEELDYLLTPILPDLMSLATSAIRSLAYGDHNMSPLTKSCKLA